MRPAVLLLSSCLLLQGCVWVPTSWRLAGTATEKAEKKEEKRDDARDALTAKARESAHKASAAMTSPQSDRRDKIASEYLDEAVAALDQSLGAPQAGDLAKWRKLVADLLSENTEVRRKAEEQRSKDSAELARLARKLSDSEEALDRAEKKVREYAEENARIADYLRKAVWAVIGLGLLSVIGFAFSLYVKFALGGFPSAVSAALSQLDTTHPDAAKVARGVVNEVLDRREKKQLSKP